MSIAKAKTRLTIDDLFMLPDGDRYELVHGELVGVQKRNRSMTVSGVPLVWVVDPQQRIVQVHRPDGRVQQLREYDQLSGEEVIPGCSCRLGDLFPALAAS